MIIIIKSRDDVSNNNNNNQTNVQEQKFNETTVREHIKDLETREQKKWDPGDHWGILTLMIVFQPFLISFFITCLSKYFGILDKNRKEPVKLEIKEVTGFM